MPEENQTPEEQEVYNVQYDQHIHFEKDCGVKKVIIYQYGKPGGGDPPPGTGGGGTDPG